LDILVSTVIFSRAEICLNLFDLNLWYRLF